jgi:hypothetical protein
MWCGGTGDSVGRTVDGGGQPVFKGLVGNCSGTEDGKLDNKYFVLWVFTFDLLN